MSALYPRLLTALEATWPPAESVESGGWRLRRSPGGGSRVSSAIRLSGEPDERAIAAAAEAMRGWGQTPVIQIREGDEAADALLAAQGWEKYDETLFFEGDPAQMRNDASEVARIIHAERPLALMEEIWAEDQIGPDRLAVMARAPGPKSYVFARLKDRPAAVAFLGLDGDTGMVHALVTTGEMRRMGAARMMMGGAARWLGDMGAKRIALAVTKRNEAGIALYRSLGMNAAGGYHYRRLRGEPDDGAETHSA